MYMNIRIEEQERLKKDKEKFKKKHAEEYRKTALTRISSPPTCLQHTCIPTYKPTNPENNPTIPTTLKSSTNRTNSALPYTPTPTNLYIPTLKGGKDS